MAHRRLSARAPTRSRGGPTRGLPSERLLALRRWTLAELYAALSADAVTILPPLLSLRALTVRLPEYLVRALETMAAEDATTLDDWLHHELIDFAGTVVDRMETILPGYRRAYLYPGQE
jgi:hypothetical protein